MQNKTQKEVSFKMSGWVGVLAALAITGVLGYYLYSSLALAASAPGDQFLTFLVGGGKGVCILVLFFIIMSGNVSLKPNQAVVYTFMGTYKGTLTGPGFYWVPCWWGAYKSCDLAVKTIRIEKIEVNEKGGNPIIVGCDIFVKLQDTYASTFTVSNVDSYLIAQGEVCLRKLVMTHPMDAEDNQTSLRGSHDEVINDLKKELTEKYANAGYIVEGAALTRLSYAPEIAAEMLQKQRATVLIAARKTIVEGALGIVEDSIKQLGEKEVTFSPDGKEKYVSNMMVVLCSSQSVSPVLTVNS